MGRAHVLHPVAATVVNPAQLDPVRATDVCIQYHLQGMPHLQPGPAGSVEHHTRRATDSEGSACVACHMPQIARTIGDVNVRGHTFRFISPLDTERYGVPNPCTSCHTDGTNAWAVEALRSWPHVSPWRVAAGAGNGARAFCYADITSSVARLASPVLAHRSTSREPRIARLAWHFR